MNGDIICGDCGAPMKEYDLCLNGGVTGEEEVVCPNKWRTVHP
jgi:hypothetical protein